LDLKGMNFVVIQGVIFPLEHNIYLQILAATQQIARFLPYKTI
jgi:hypothetical protein